MDKTVYSIKEAMAAIGIGKTTLYGHIDAGNLPITKIGGRTFISAEALKEFISKDWPVTATYRKQNSEARSKPMKTKKLPYGEKAYRVNELLATTDLSDKQIASKVGCASSYVHHLRHKGYAQELKSLEADGLVQPEPKPEPKPTIQEPPKVDELDGVLDKRASTYGSFMQSANVAVRIKAVMHNAIAREDLHLMPDQMLALDMIAVKISRILSGNSSHRDSWLDIAGYAKLVADRLGGVSR